MPRTKLIETYAEFDTPDMPQRIAEYIDKYIESEGIEELPYRELHGRHTGHLDISDGGFRMDYDFLRPVLDLCKLDRHGVLSADLNKINKSLDQWREDLHNPPEFESEDGEEMPDHHDDEWFDASDYDDDDSPYEFKNASYKAELDSYMALESPTAEDMIAHENNMDEIWSMRSDADHKDADGDDDYIEVPEREYTEEEIEIYLQAVDDMYMKEKAQLETCRRIFYNEGKEALHEFLLSKESYKPDPKYEYGFDDPEYFDSMDIKRFREKFDVWDEEKRDRELEEMYQRWKADVDNYWNDPNRERRGDWICPTFAEDMRQMYLEERNRPSFAEFVSDLRRGIYGELPEDYDGLACPGDPGYYGEEE